MQWCVDMRKYETLIILSLVILLGANPLFSQNQSNTSIYKPSPWKSQQKGFLDHLLNSSRIKMSHSYSLSYMSMGRQSFNQGLYLNTLDINIADPLQMQVRFGYLHQPLGNMNNQQMMDGKLFLQRAMLKYEPTENMSIVFDYQAYPSPTMLPNRYYYRNPFHSFDK